MELLKVRRHLPDLVLGVAVIEGTRDLPPLAFPVVLSQGGGGHPAQRELPLVGGGAQHDTVPAAFLMGWHLVPRQPLLAIVTGEDGELGQALVGPTAGPTGIAAAAADLVLVRGDGRHGEVAAAEVAT